MVARLPEETEMMAAFQAGDVSYDGIFFVGVKTTGIFCLPSCPARKPLPQNVRFFASPQQAVQEGFRPCKRCRPLDQPGTMPGWVRELVDELDRSPSERFTDALLKQRGFRPDRIRRWFKGTYGMTFQAYQRARRVGSAIEQIQSGSQVIMAAFDHGYESVSGFNDAVRQFIGVSPLKAKETKLVTIRLIDTPVGPMLAGATNEALCLFEFLDRRMLPTQLTRLQRLHACTLVPGSNEILDRTADAFEAYFAGEMRQFDLPLSYPGSTFQKRVWDHLIEVPYGETISYGALARKIGQPEAVRAVARANGDNRLAIIIPCHRVIGSDGSLTGYGGGLWRKRWLLDHEQRHAGGPRTPTLFG